MTRYQLAFAPFLNKYIDDELSKHYGGRRVTGVLPGLQNQCGAWYVPGGFDSHMSPPKERKKNMGMNQTPVSERVHIGFFGKRNAGKSSVMNAVTGQNLAVVSDVKGTTTDPVYKTMELLPLGPVVMMAIVLLAVHRLAMLTRAAMLSSAPRFPLTWRVSFLMIKSIPPL